MSCSGGDSGCGCLILIGLAAFFLGGGTLVELAGVLAGVLAAGWLGYLVFVGVSLGIVVLIAGLISGR